MLLQDRRKPVIRGRMVPIHNRVAIVVVLCAAAFAYWRLVQ
jgi:hypothetical protein